MAIKTETPRRKNTKRVLPKARVVRLKQTGHLMKTIGGIRQGGNGGDAGLIGRAP